MARSVNKVTLIGNLGGDPELRYTDSGTAVCNMSLATDESYTDQDGKEVQQTEWHDVVAWDRLGEICEEYLEKGSQVYFEGKLQTREWEDRDGNTRQSTEIKAQEVMFLDSNRRDEGKAGQRSSGGGAGSRGGPGSGGRSGPSGDGQPGGSGSAQSGGGQSGGGGFGSGGSGGGSQSDEDTFEPDDDLPF